MHDPWMPALEYATALSMICWNAVTYLFRTIHVNIVLQRSELYVAFDAANYPCWNMNSTHKHLVAVLGNTF